MTAEVIDLAEARRRRDARRLNLFFVLAVAGALVLYHFWKGESNDG